MINLNFYCGVSKGCIDGVVKNKADDIQAPSVVSVWRTAYSVFLSVL